MKNKLTIQLSFYKHFTIINTMLCEDIFDNISQYLPLTDIKHLALSCKTYGNFCKDKVRKLYPTYKKISSHIRGFTCVVMYNLYNVIEVSIDGYFHLIKDMKLYMDDDIAKYIGDPAKRVVYQDLIRHKSVATMVCIIAAYCGHVSALKWFMSCRDFFCAVSEQISLAALRNNQLKTIKYLHESKLSPNSLRYLSYRHIATIYHCNSDVIQWNMENANVFNINYSELICSVAERGDIKMFQWLLDHDCVVNDFANVVKRGHLHILECAAKNNVMIVTEHLYYVAASEGHINILDWFENNYGECNYDMYTIYNDACSSHKFNVVTWCISRGYKISEEDIIHGLIYSRTHFVEYCIQNNMITERCMARISEQKFSYSIPIIQLLLQHDLLHLDAASIDTLYQNGQIISNMIKLIKFPEERLQYHFTLSNFCVSKQSYGTPGAVGANNIVTSNNNQKLMHLEDDSSVTIYNFKNDCECWWMFYMFDVDNSKTKTYCIDKICKCEYHKDLGEVLQNCL